MAKRFDPAQIEEEYGIRPDVLEYLEIYLNIGRVAGGFLRAVLEGNLYEAAVTADGSNGRNLAGIARFIYHKFPTDAYGTPEKVQKWELHDGLKGGKYKTYA